MTEDEEEPKEPREAVVTIRLTRRERDFLELDAFQAGRTVSSHVRWMILREMKGVGE